METKADAELSPEPKCKRRTRGNIQNNLELYLNDVYEKECVFKIDEKEVEFIRTGIETLVGNIVDKVLESDEVGSEIGEIIKDEIERRKQNDQETSVIIQDHLIKKIVEVYFPIGSGSYFQQYPHIKSTRSSIIRVGSFYEGTKNAFPDEFDFIFFLFCGSEETPNEILLKLRVYMERCIRNAVATNKTSLHYTSTKAEHSGSGELYFDEYLYISGPAHTLQFIYRNCDQHESYILVDLVPAEKLIVSKTLRSYKNFERFLIKPKSFREAVLSAESFLKLLHSSISLTQKEVHFIKNVLSKNHVKVYRIMKYLINGHGDGEKLKEYNITNFDMRRVAYSSYQIKTMIIDHHDECTNTDTENIGPCVLQVLEEMCKYDDINDFPKFIEQIYYTGHPNFCLFPYLTQLTETLRSMQKSVDTYDYDSNRINPLSRQYLSDVRHIPADVIHERLKSRMPIASSNKFYGRSRQTETVSTTNISTASSN